MATLLTTKEQQVLRLRYSGLTNADIAKKLNVSPADISQTFKRVSNKLRNVGDTLQLMREAGLLETTSPIKLTSKGQAALEEVGQIESKKLDVGEMVGELEDLERLQPFPALSTLSRITDWKNEFELRQPVILDYSNMSRTIIIAAT